jgi:tagaturonate reductase
MEYLSHQLMSAQNGQSIAHQERPALPEKVLQFGTGVLLRGLPDFLIEVANRQGIFQGRIVVVKSTSSGDTAAFDQQDNL